MQTTFKLYKPRYNQLKERKNKKIPKIFRHKCSSFKLARARTPKFSQNINKSIKLKVTENKIDRVIQIDMEKKSLQWGEGGESTPITNTVNLQSSLFRVLRRVMFYHQIMDSGEKSETLIRYPYDNCKED